MNRKFYRLIPLLMIAFLSVGVASAQGDYARRDNNRYDRSRDQYDKRDRNDRYDHNRGRNDRYDGYHEIRRRPHSPSHVRPVRPSSVHIWIDGAWAWNNGRYAYTPGYWTAPRHGYVWVPGHWQRTRHGWYWVNGFWQSNRGRW